MHRISYVATILITCCAAGGAADSDVGRSRALGIGVILGEPAGVTAKYWLSERTALDAAVSWDPFGREALHLHADYLLHWRGAFTVQSGAWAPYGGLGTRVRFRERVGNDDDDRITIGIRAPVGISYLFEKIPLELFAELAPTLDLDPDVGIDLDGGVGARWYF